MELVWDDVRDEMFNKIYGCSKGITANPAALVCIAAAATESDSICLLWTIGQWSSQEMEAQIYCWRH